MPRSSVNFPLILSALLLLLLWFRLVFASQPTGLTDASLKLCNFDEDNRKYNVTDLLLCMNEQAGNILFHQSTNPDRITDRAYQDTRQSYPAYPFTPAYSIPPASAVAAAPSNYFGNEMLSQLLSGAFKLPSFSNLFDFSGLTRPGFNFFNALSSIAQYDDLKCVPRILCEVASGSMPGSLTYRQSSGFQNFGSNALFGLLTAFDSSGTSPILSFGRAALLGYANRGQPHMCYREYSRCPQDSAQLISYLNNHKGGFFRFFNGNAGAYYPQQYYGYRPQNYYKNSDESEYRIIQQSQYPTSQIFSEADIKEDGSGVFKFSNSNYYNQDKDKPDFFTMQVRESGPGNILFPKDKRENKFLSNYFNRPSFDSSNNYQTYNFQKESISKDRKIFPLASDNYNDYPTTNQIDNNNKPHVEQFGDKVSYVRFPRDTYDKKELRFFFSNNHRNQYKDY